MTSSNGNIFALLAFCAGNSPATGHKGQWRGTLMFSLKCAWINGWVNNREVGDLIRYRTNYDVTGMCLLIYTRSSTVNASCHQNNSKWYGYKYKNELVPYPTMCHSEQKCAHLCAKCSIVGYGKGVFWDLLHWSVEPQRTQTMCIILEIHSTWWRHQMKTFSALLVLCPGNSLVTGEFPSQRPVTWSFGVFFDLRLNKRLNKHSWSWWFATPSRSLWRHCN